MRLDPAGVQPPNRSRHAFRARHLLAVASGLGLLAAAGCGSSGSPGGAVSSTVTIAAIPGVDDAAVYLAKKDGIFAAEGLKNVRIVTYTSQSAELAALQSAQADIAASDYGDIFYHEAQSPDLRILADGYDATEGVLEVLTLPSSPITSPADLADANVHVGLPDDDVLSGLENSGIPAPKSLDEAAATDVLSDYIGAEDESVSWVPMSQSQEIAALDQHKVQAILVGEPYIYEAESQLGAVEVLDACSGATAGLPLLGYVAMSPWVKDHPDAVADFQAALAKAQADASMTGQVQAVLPGLPGATRISAQDADMVTVGSYPAGTSAASLEQVVRLMNNSHMFNVGAPPAVPPMIVQPKG